MENQELKSKPSSPEQPSGKGLSSSALLVLRDKAFKEHQITEKRYWDLIERWREAAFEEFRLSHPEIAREADELRTLKAEYDERKAALVGGEVKLPRYFLD